MARALSDHSVNLGVPFITSQNPTTHSAKPNHASLPVHKSFPIFPDFLKTPYARTQNNPIQPFYWNKLRNACKRCCRWFSSSSIFTAENSSQFASAVVALVVVVEWRRMPKLFSSQHQHYCHKITHITLPLSPCIPLRSGEILWHDHGRAAPPSPVGLLFCNCSGLASPD